MIANDHISPTGKALKQQEILISCDVYVMELGMLCYLVFVSPRFVDEWNGHLGNLQG